MAILATFLFVGIVPSFSSRSVGALAVHREPEESATGQWMDAGTVADSSPDLHFLALSERQIVPMEEKPTKNLATIAVTGGVACGKSAFCSGIADRAAIGEIEVFSCDEEVRHLLGDAEVGLRIEVFADALGRSVFDADAGQLDRTALRDLLFENSEFRGMVERELHPKVLEAALRRRAEAAGSARILVVEVPLLYEVAFPLPRDFDVVVGASAKTQLGRLVTNRALPVETARRILETQMPIEEKLLRADIVVWNDGALPAFEAQISHLFSRFQSLFPQ